MQRRACMRLLAGAALAPAWTGAFAGGSDAAAGSLSAADVAFLDEMERRGCLYFVEQAGAATGQVLDRAANATDGKRDKREMASIAATGFGLAALCIADKRGYLPRKAVLEQVRRTLRFHCDELENVHGFYYHFAHVETGERYRDVELSSIDTALLLCGVLTARGHFSEDAEIQRLATTMYNRVDWPWMLNGGATFSMGWKPESGFLKSRWNHFSELMMLYLLAMGSPTHPVDAASWDAFARPEIHYDGLTYISGNDPLFTQQYSQAYFDFRGKRDRYADYFANSVRATQAHKAFCLALGAPYSEDYWGISASDSAHGYTAWGGPNAKGEAFGGVDGSVVPYATAGSLPFLPQACMRVQRSLQQRYGERAWGRYGFCDAFHPQAGWYDPDVLGIDLGISVLMAENLRSGTVWRAFAKNPEVGVAMRRAGFRST